MSSIDNTTMVSSNSNPNPTPPIVHTHIDAPFPTGSNLNENNYSLWSKVMKMRINGRKMWGYINGTKVKPAEGSEEYENWCSENDKVKGWLCDSMSTTLMHRYVCLDTAKEVWESLEAMYIDTSDETQIFELHRKCFSTKQSGRSLATYYDELAAIFQEIDQRNTMKGESIESIALLQKYVGRLRVHMFLSGLDSMYDQVRGEILRKDPPLTLEQTYQTVRRVSVHKQVMGTQAPVTESSVMALNFRKGQPNRESRPPRLDLECTHCGEKGHTKDKCYEVIGYPEWWDFTKRPRKNIAQKKDTTKNHSSVNVAQSGMETKGSISSVNSLNNTWLIDSGATDHMVNDSSILSSFTPSTQTTINTANGGSSPVVGEGSTDISESLSLKSVLIVPALEYNILSVSRITIALTCTVTFWPQFCVFQDIVTRQVLGCGVRKGNLYYLDLTDSGEQRIHQVNKVGGIKDQTADVWLWHRRLGHLSFGYLQKLNPSLFLNCSISDFKCDICELAKSHRITYSPSFNKSSNPFSIIHSDVWGPARISTLSGSRYFVTFIDECTRMMWVSLITYKSEVFEVFKKFYHMVLTQFQRKIQVYQSDNGGEFTSNDMSEFLTNNGIRHQTSNAYTPQQNGLAERMNRKLLEVVRASLFGMNMPLNYWGEALKSAAYLINRTPSRVIGFQTPFKKLHDLITIPAMPNLEPRVFGCVVFVHIPKHQRGKLDHCARKCVFIGYADFKKGYRCYDPVEGKVFISLDVSFRESEAYFMETSLQGEKQDDDEGKLPVIGDMFHELEELTNKLNNCNDGDENERETEKFTDGDRGSEDNIHMNEEDLMTGGDHMNEETLTTGGDQSDVEEVADILTPPTEDLPSNVEPQVLPNPNPTNDTHPRRSERSTKGIPKPSYEPDINSKAKYSISNYVSTHRLTKSFACTINQLSSVSIPSNLQEALSNPKWKKAMNEEMDALQKNSTWDLVDKAQGHRIVGCRWIFTVKMNSDGTIDRYKARLVAKGYTQTYGVDYEETFAPVAKINTIRILVSLAANQDWPLYQFDVKNAFLNGDLEEEVYMELPPGVINSEEGKVCKLKKALYGLKQSPRAWFGRFTKSMKTFGYRQSNSDHTLFIKRKSGMLTALIVYVDDMVITGNDSVEIEALKNYLSQEFEMKDLGQLKYFLGIEVARSSQGISMSQRKYVLDLLAETGMLDCRPVDTPIEANHHLGIFPDQVPCDKGRYQRLVGRLIYLSHTRPDIAYAISIVSQFMHNPSDEHMKAVFRILRYLKKCPGKGLLFQKGGNMEVMGYTDADWAGDITTRRSTSGYFAFVCGNLVTFKAKKQKVVARSSAESEFRGMAHGVCELLWIKNILKDLGFNLMKAMDLHCDNKAAIMIAHNPIQHDRMKHVEVDRFFIRENIDKGCICFPFVKSEDQLADILTKGVCGRIFNKAIDKLGMIDIYAPNLRGSVDL